MRLLANNNSAILLATLKNGNNIISNSITAIKKSVRGIFGSANNTKQLVDNTSVTIKYILSLPWWLPNIG